MTDITLPIVAVIFIAVWAADKWISSRPDHEAVLRQLAREGTALAQDRKLMGVFNSAESKGRAALEYGTVYVLEEARKRGLEYDRAQVENACRIAYQLFVAGRG